DVVEGQVVRIDKDEILVDIGAKSEGVVSNRELYGRHAESQPQLAIGDTVLVYVLQPESQEGHVVLSLRRAGLERKRRSMQEKVALYEERREKRDELFSSLQVGQKVKGTVRSIAPFGVFVDLGGIDGLVHKSELSWNKVNNPESGYRVGEEVEAEVIDINHERGRISLSIRRLQPDPWHSTVADLKVG